MNAPNRGPDIACTLLANFLLWLGRAVCCVRANGRLHAGIYFVIGGRRTHISCEGCASSQSSTSFTNNQDMPIRLKDSRDTSIYALSRCKGAGRHMEACTEKEGK
jgi:hypothetical protein